MPSPIRVIANPVAGRGRAARLLPAVRAAFRAVGVPDVWETRAAGDELTLARRALDEGAGTIAVLGGDGTWSKVARAILERGADCRLAPINGGSGNDFTKNFALPAGDPAAMARLAREGPDVRIDTGTVDGTHFINVVGFGFDTAVLEDMTRIHWLRGDALYYAAAVRQLFRFRGMPVSLEDDAGAPVLSPRRELLVAIANGRWFGGNFAIAPEAAPTDGLLDLVAIGDTGPLGRARLFLGAPRGRHVRSPECATRRGAGFTLRFEAPPLCDIDGELRRAPDATVEVRVLPASLRLVSASPAASRPTTPGSAP